MKQSKMVQVLCKNQKMRFVIAITLLTLLGFISTSLISYFVAHQAVSKQITQSALPLTSDNIYSEIQRDLMSPVFIASLMAQDTFVRDWAISGGKEPQPLIRYLSEIQKKYKTVTAFFVLDETRQYYHPNGVIQTIQPGPVINEWYFRVKKMPTEYEINIDHDTANPERLSVFVNYKVFDYNHQFIGATGVGLALDKVQQLIENYQRKFNRVVYFIDKNGELTLRGSQFSANAKTLQQPEFKNVLDKDTTTTAASFQYQSGSHTVYVNTRFIPEFNWYVVIEQTDDAQTKKLFNSLMINVVVSIVISIIVLVASYYTLAAYQRRLEYMATTDRLSGAFNRHSFDILFEQHLRLAERKNKPFSGILLDIDYFKAINDKYGHVVGDEVIKQLVGILRQQLRESDMLCRWGGEEFLILLPECQIAAAVDIAEQTRKMIQGFEFSQEIKLTASFGVAEFNIDEHPSCQEKWISDMDKALYQAKANGRNTVVEVC
ncbi:sensor domain-containing diguanylate cyclase [Catenovulum adriaticum]|uniref:diguanylate cyclase n=1 Tax=Catenovulum adriaticum TaxID=2984846 RepID=A0ABY7ALL4_9ALTE|nr:sensor domain-containing diguanylate cyclase [Catenovulum sp. TS8]WAJ70445.1 sensor domain-containing diguanylate cyclase [Catenovulum sp. TS8]